MSKTYLLKEGGVHSMQVVLGDRALPSDGKRKGPSRQLDRPAHKLVLLVSNDVDKGQ